MNFVRGMDPMRAMKIGVITWNNLSAGCHLKTRRWVPLYHRPDESLRFVSDGAKQTAHILALETVVIEKIERIKNNNRLRIEYQAIKGVMKMTLEGSVERFRKYFDIVQER